jgi:hypothetical protein
MLTNDQIIYDGTVVADISMRVYTKYAELCARQKNLSKVMNEEKYFGSMEEAKKLRDKCSELEDMRADLLELWYEGVEELFARIERECKPN